MSQQLGSEEYRKARQGKQINCTQDSSLKEEELPWVGFEPTALCSLGERSTRMFYCRYNKKCIFILVAMKDFPQTIHFVLIGIGSCWRMTLVRLQYWRLLELSSWTNSVNMISLASHLTREF